MSKLNLTAAAALGATLFAAGAASATTVNWADLTSQTSATHINGTIATGSGPVGVTYDGSIFFSQITGGGTDYWVDGGYTQGVVNRPPGTDIIAISDGGMKTITFDRTVTDVFIAFTSWNGNFASLSASSSGGTTFTVRQSPTQRGEAPSATR